MTTKTEITALNHTVTETDEWLKALADLGPFENQQQAYSHFRAVLHALRDRLTVEEATHLASELPMLVRGFYYEGWRPALAPNDQETQAEFMDKVRESLDGQMTSEDELRAAVKAVFQLLENRIEEGQIRHVRAQLPEQIEALWEG
ncbi:MAG: DUF2267 domain-containing protein [Longimicrobiales bacterium]